MNTVNNDRTIESIFIGNFENNTQALYRNNGIRWDNVLSECHITKGSNKKFTNEEYLLKLRNSKYGLCLRGYGSKCHREIELMAFGTVPIITNDVCITSFYNPPIENLHYIKVNSPDELQYKISNITGDEWSKMSIACHEWYKTNVHSSKAWTTMIEKILYYNLE